MKTSIHLKKQFLFPIALFLASGCFAQNANTEKTNDKKTIITTQTSGEKSQAEMPKHQLVETPKNQKEDNLRTNELDEYTKHKDIKADEIKADEPKSEPKK